MKKSNISLVNNLYIVQGLLKQQNKDDEVETVKEAIRSINSNWRITHTICASCNGKFKHCNCPKNTAKNSRQERMDLLEKKLEIATEFIKMLAEESQHMLSFKERSIGKMWEINNVSLYNEEDY